MSLEDEEARLKAEIVEREALIAKIQRQRAIDNKPKRKAKGDYLVPYENGDLMTWASKNWDRVEWRHNVPFMATMTLDNKTSRTHDYGRTTKYWWRDEEGHFYPMFPTSLYKAVVDGATISESKISGIWQVTKKGENYGIEWQSD